jgi:hypothetical protein
MPGIDFHRELQEVKGPDRPGRTSALDGQLALNLTAHATEPSVVGAFMGAALPDYRESKQQSNERNHSTVTQRPTFESKPASDAIPWAESTKNLVPGLWEYRSRFSH